MNKQDLIRDMKSHVGGKAFINASNVAKYMGWSRDRLPNFLDGIEFLQVGKAKQYFIPDVATRILENKIMN